MRSAKTRLMHLRAASRNDFAHARNGRGECVARKCRRKKKHTIFSSTLAVPRRRVGAGGGARRRRGRAAKRARRRGGVLGHTGVEVRYIVPVSFDSKCIDMYKVASAASNASSPPRPLNRLTNAIIIRRSTTKRCHCRHCPLRRPRARSDSIRRPRARWCSRTTTKTRSVLRQQTRRRRPRSMKDRTRSVKPPRDLAQAPMTAARTRCQTTPKTPASQGFSSLCH